MAAFGFWHISVVIWAMLTAVSAAVAFCQMILFCKYNVAIFIVVKVFILYHLHVVIKLIIGDRCVVLLFSVLPAVVHQGQGFVAEG